MSGRLTVGVILGLVFAVAAPPAPAVGQEGTPDHPEAEPSDVESPSAIVQALVESYSSEAGERPEWERYFSLFLPEARLIPTGRDSAGEPVHQVQTVRQVVESLETNQRIEQHLVERLIHTEIERFGDIAHVLCTYEVFNSAGRSEPTSRGIGSLQLWYDGDRWWIASMMWHGERTGARIPEEYGG